ncbi:MAG: acyl-CoA thioesterase [Myxococcaceae bacterium]|nr:acyl-CoA thioesterase [Myxococcaceae bacterium]
MGSPTPHALEVSSAVRTRVTFSETDAVGAVHHRCAVVWFERAREAYFRERGVGVASYAARGLYLAVRELTVRYDSFVSYDDELEIRVALTHLGRVALELSYRVDDLTTGALALRGTTTMVAVEARPPSPVPVLGRIRFDRQPFVPLVIPRAALWGED